MHKLSKDPYPTSINNPQTINRYVYCLNNPISMYDANGLYGNKDVANNHTSSIMDFANDNPGDISDIALYLAGELAKLPTKSGAKTILTNDNTLYSFSKDFKLTSGFNALEILGGVGYIFALNDFHKEVSGIADQYINSKISGFDAWTGIMNSSFKVIIPGYSTVRDLKVPERIMNGYMNGVTWLGNQIGGGIYDAFH